MLINPKTGQKRHFDKDISVREGAGGFAIGISAYSMGFAKTPTQKVAALSFFIATASAFGAEELEFEDVNPIIDDQTNYLNKTLVGSDSNFNDGDLS